MNNEEIPDPTKVRSPRGSHRRGSKSSAGTRSAKEKLDALLDKGLEATDQLLERLDRLGEIGGPDKDEPLWDINEVADYFDVSKRTVETLIAEGELKPIRVRSLRRFDPSEIRDYCRRQEE